MERFYFRRLANMHTEVWRGSDGASVGSFATIDAARAHAARCRLLDRQRNPSAGGAA